MNERIKELAVKSDLLIKKTNGNEFRYGYFDPKFEKFAELIIRECCDIFLELRTRPADLAVKDIKRHFGV